MPFLFGAVFLLVVFLPVPAAATFFFPAAVFFLLAAAFAFLEVEVFFFPSATNAVLDDFEAGFEAAITDAGTGGNAAFIGMAFINAKVTNSG